MAKSKGEYVYWLDADMELPKNLIDEAVHLAKKGFDGIILPEDSFGIGMWARTKQFERRCYWGDMTVESPRFFTKKAWDDIGGFDLSLGAGGDDIDLTYKLKENGYAIARTVGIVRHNEGNLSIGKLFKKRFMYGREMIHYLKKRPQSWVTSYNPIKLSYFRNWKEFLLHPTYAVLLPIMRIIEYAGGLAGFIYALVKQKGRKIDGNHTSVYDYSDVSSQYYQATVPKLLRKYLESVPYSSLLDLGCGDGSLLFALNQEGFLRGKMIYAVDMSPKSIQLVKSINPRIHAAVDNVEHLKIIKNKSVNFCVSTMVIEHVDDAKLLRSVRDVLTNKGYAYITTVFKKPYGWYFYRRDGKWVMDVTHEREYTDDMQLLKLVYLYNFTVVEARKTLIWFPIIDFFARRMHLTDRAFFIKNIAFNIIRGFKVPILGYYEWELVLRKQERDV